MLFYSGSGSSDGADVGANEKMSPSKLSEFTSPSPGPSTNSYTLLNQNDNVSFYFNLLTIGKLNCSIFIFL